MSCYAMMVFLLSGGLCKDIEYVLNKYWWSGSTTKGKGVKWKSWNGLCAPKKKGGLGFRCIREMNLALLGKQVWRLLTRPESLVTKVYKCRYYPICSLFEATAGSNPSFVWRGLLEALDARKSGCYRSIGDGRSTIIGRDPWLPCAENSYVTTDLHDSIKDVLVSSLLNVQGSNWDEECF
ncbi:PREDICTED: uncharacterized protein LOC109169485 [Ipomoea nil]|uniref:uncharacterized protein LOC109169485 n=1 Tax=Ipomoea nil TaxID=35883 RepID=UPI0009015BE0|nr:PREDICTED: uncharacterized protein LOC109169485 [Ipomoea nil]